MKSKFNNKKVLNLFIIGLLIYCVWPVFKVNAETFDITSLDYEFKYVDEDFDSDVQQYIETNLDRESIINTIKDDYEYYYDDIFKYYFDDSDYYKSYHEELDDVYYEVYSNVDLKNKFGINGVFDIKGKTDQGKSINTTYDNDGYFTAVTFNNSSFSYDVRGGAFNGYIKHQKDGFIVERYKQYSLDVTLKKINDKTIVATYKLKNNSSKSAPFKIASFTDSELGGNDNAAISKTKSEITLTQDAMSTKVFHGGMVDVSHSYGAQFHIKFNPNPSTIFVGPYANSDYSADYYFDRIYESSDRDYYTKNDNIDSTLAYSWQGTIDAGETKTFTATFTINKAGEIELNFFHDGKDEPTDDSPITVVGGGAFKTPVASLTPEEGYNIKWYANKNGTGTGYYPDTWSIAPNESTNYYEVKKPNTVVPSEEEKATNYFNAEIELNDSIIEQFKSEAENSYDDIKIVLEVDKLDLEGLGENKAKFEEKVKEGYTLGTYFDVNLFKLVNNANKESISATDKPLKIMLHIPKELLPSDDKHSRNYILLRLHDDEVDTIDCDFDEETGSLIVESDKFSLYALTYEEYEKPEVKNPKTSDNIVIYTAVLLISVIGCASTIVYLNKKN